MCERLPLQPQFSFFDAAELAMKRRQQKFQGEVERLRSKLLQLTVMQPNALGNRVTTLTRTIEGQKARSNRGARAEAEAKAAAAANALEQEELYGGANIVVDGLRAGQGMQLLLVDPIFDFHMGCFSNAQSGFTPLLLVHVQHRCYVALTSRGQEELKACAGDYTQSASLYSALSSFGGSDDAVAAAARDKAAAIAKMQALLSSPSVQNSDLQRLLSLNAACFLNYKPMVAALQSLLVEQLQRCVRTNCNGAVQCH